MSVISPLPNSTCRRVLVVEDHDDTREMLKTILSLEIFIVIEARDGEEGYVRAMTESPDLILMDLTLPGIDGLAVTRQIRNSDGVSKTPIIFLTARAEPVRREAAYEAGCNDFLTKPFDLDEVLLVVHRWLASRDGS